VRGAATNGRIDQHWRVRGHTRSVTDEVELIGGREKRAIQLVAYDPSWPRRFEQERARIADALGPIARRIDHIGSTAVRGLAAKPVIDIDLSVDDPDLEEVYLPALQRAGYILRVRSPGHRMARSAELDVHVHVCPAGGEWERRHPLPRLAAHRRDRSNPLRERQAATGRPRLGRHERVRRREDRRHPEDHGVRRALGAGDLMEPRLTAPAASLNER
jgi:GrpB-like predicted nucleotidyltransferase (UPF0157 family)